MSEAKYLLRGGPRDGELIDPPPAAFNVVADALYDAFGAERPPSAATIAGEGWVYEFSAGEAGVLVGRPATDEELLIQEAWAELRAEDAALAAERARMAELSPHVLATLKQAERLLEGNRCVAARHGELAIFIARGETAAAWEEALKGLGPEVGCNPEPAPDDVWDCL